MGKQNVQAEKVYYGWADHFRLEGHLRSEGHLLSDAAVTSLNVSVCIVGKPFDSVDYLYFINVFFVKSCFKANKH